MIPFPTSLPLVGSSIELRILDPERDVDELFPATHGSPEGNATWDFLAYGPFADPAAMLRWLRECAGSRDPSFRAVVETGSGKPVGMVSFMRVRPEWRVLEIGHIWYVPASRRTRANTETCYLMLRHAFDDLGYRRVEWKCDDRNLRSKAAALRLGFRYEGTFRKHMIVKGRNRDTAWYAMLDDDWPGVRSRLEHWLAAPPGSVSLSGSSS